MTPHPHRRLNNVQTGVNPAAKWSFGPPYVRWSAVREGADHHGRLSATVVVPISFGRVTAGYSGLHTAWRFSK